MDLIGSVGYIENRLGGRKSSHGDRKSAPKNVRVDAVEEKKEQADDNHSPAEYDTRLGQSVDTTA